MSYMGSWKIDDLLTFTVNTHTPSTGAAADADAAPSYRVYEDETATPLLTGSMALLDTANTDGFYSEQITLSAASGFEKGKSYSIYVSAAVGGITGTISHSFQMEAEVDANVVSDKTGYALTTAEQDAIVDKVWNEPRSGHVAAGTFGEGVKAEALNAQAKSDVNAEVDNALDTAIPGSPTADSVNERLKRLEEDVTPARAANLDNLDAPVTTRSTFDPAADNVDLVNGFTATGKGQINAEVVDVITVDTIAELTADPGATPTLQKAVMLAYMAIRNQGTETASARTIKNNAGTTILTAAMTDDGTTFTKGKFA